MSLCDWITAHRQSARHEAVRIVTASSIGSESQSMIAASYSFAVDSTNTKRCETMGAAIKQRVHAAALITVEKDWLVKQFASERPTLADLVSPSRHVPGIAQKRHLVTKR